MHRNPYWIGLVVIVALSALWQGGKGGYTLFRFLKQSKKAYTNEVHFTAIEVKSGIYAPLANFTFTYEDHPIQGKSTLNQYRSKNQRYLEEGFPKMEKKSWKVWYDPKNPKNATLEKRFPYKEIFSGGVMTGIFLYFIWLGFYVNRFRK